MQFITYLFLFLLIGASIAAYVSWSHGILSVPTWMGIPSSSGEGFRPGKGANGTNGVNGTNNGKRRAKKSKELFDSGSSNSGSVNGSSSSGNGSSGNGSNNNSGNGGSSSSGNGSNNSSGNGSNNSSGNGGSGSSKSSRNGGNGIRDTIDQATYDARIYIMQIFEAILHRKPTNAELDKYSAFGPSQSAIMNAIVKENRHAQIPSGCEEDACALPTLAGSNEEACDEESSEDSESDSCSEDELSDDDDYDYGIPSNEWKRPDLPSINIRAPRPFAPTITFDRAPDVDIKVSTKMSTPQPCLDRMDVLKRLQAISDDVENFKKYVTML